MHAYFSLCHYTGTLFSCLYGSSTLLSWSTLISRLPDLFQHRKEVHEIQTIIVDIGLYIIIARLGPKACWGLRGAGAYWVGMTSLYGLILVHHHYRVCCPRLATFDVTHLISLTRLHIFSLACKIGEAREEASLGRMLLGALKLSVTSHLVHAVHD